ncbi:MAG: GFA family protein, partial [Oceanospirillaceae bacterium]
MINRSCCCEAVLFELAEMPSMMGTCLCNRCRKVGASTLVFVKAETFQITKSLDQITTVKAIPAYKYDRCFCAICGAALGEVLSKDESFPVSANCIDGDIELDNRFHEFVSQQPSW